MRRPIRLAAMVAALLAATPALAFDPAAMTDAERAAFRAEIRSYLLENPDVLQEAMIALEEKQAQDQLVVDRALVQANAGDIFNDGYSWVGGNPEGDITLVEFLDYRCGYCKKAHAEVAELLKADGNIRFVIKEFPILGEQSELAALFAIAVQQSASPEVYKTVHDRLMTFRGDLTPAALERLAQDVGLDPAAVTARMNGPEVARVISANYALAEKLDISATPIFILQDTMLRGYLPPKIMQDVVKQVRAEQR